MSVTLGQVLGFRFLGLWLVNPGASGSAGPFSETVVRVCLQTVYSCTSCGRQHVSETVMRDCFRTVRTCISRGRQHVSETVVRVCLQAVHSCTSRQHVAARLHSSKCQCQ